MQAIKWFKDTSKKDLALVGGKGANLGELIRANVPVPDGFIVTSQAYFEFLKENDLEQKIKEELCDLDLNNSKILNSKSAKIKSSIVCGELSFNIKNQIKEAYRQLIHEKEGYVAVRSSATAEDLPEASFAGQQNTFLNVKGEDEVVKAVVNCWASLFEPRAIFYREEKSFDHLKVGIAVPIQLMVQSTASGIIFTVDPVTADKNQIMIEAGLGLGEAVVSGSITPDRYLVDKKSLKILDKEINSQEWKIEKVDGLNKHVTLSDQDKTRQKISDEQIVELAKLAIKIENYYSFPQDAEWAIEEDKISLVQSRPITTLKEKKGTTQEITKPSKAGKVILKGAAASTGSASGKVNIIHSSAEIPKIKKGDVLVTEMTTPDFVPAMKRASAIVTDSGGRTCHAAIVSRELGVPCVVGTKTATHSLKNGQTITVDGSRGEISEGVQTSIKQKTIRSDLGTMRQEIPVTATKIYVNLAEAELADEIAKRPVDGVGLLRAEFMIATIGEHPRALIKKGKSQLFVDKLSTGLERFAKAFNPRPVIYRATDFKTNEYKNLKGGEKFEDDESNPMIGYRGCFRYIKEPDLFVLELEALKKIRELGFKSLQLMIPFVRTVYEMEKVIELVDNSDLTKDRDFKLFMMAEVPSNVLLIDEFLDLPIDGISIGSNDLTQLILGVDRDNEKLAEEFDERNPAVMDAMEKLIRTTRKKGKLVSICGQAPSDYPEVVQLFVESGASSISVNPDMIEKTRKLVASIERRILLDQITQNS